ncbi:hypothetical protein Aperf_G00000099657 [Anoplocephala perfoliata]
MPKITHKRPQNISKHKGAVRGLSQHRNRSNSTNPTHGDCILNSRSRDIIKSEVPPPQCFAITSEEGLQNQQELEELTPESTIKKALSFHKSIPKGFQQLARFWPGRIRDPSRGRHSLCEKFELEGVGSTIDSSLFDDPPYEKDETSSSVLSSVSQHSKSDPYILGVPDARQEKILNHDSGDIFDGTSKFHFVKQNREAGDNDEVVRLRLCGLFSRRLKLNFPKQFGPKMSQEISEETNETEHVKGTNLQKSLLEESCANRDEIPPIAGTNDDDEITQKSIDSSSKLSKVPSVHSYRSGPESEGLRMRLKGLGLTGFPDAEEMNEWSIIGIQVGEAASRSKSPLGKVTNQSTPVAMARQSNSCNTYTHSIISIKQPCIMGNEVVHHGAKHYFKTYSPSGKNYASDKVCNNQRRKETTSKYDTFLNESPYVDDTWERNVPTDPRPVSHRGYRIAKHDVNESTASYIASEDAETNAFMDQTNNNAVNEAKPIEFALPGPVKKPTPFLSLIREAREANMIPPGLPVPSYSWEKKEVPEQDCMVLPARKPKQKAEVENSYQSAPGTQLEEISPANQVNQNGVGDQKPAPSLQSIIETMQKVKAAEAELKSKKERERVRKFVRETGKAMIASQAMENTKGVAVVDYKERRRLRQEKEIEEARKELVEAARSALKDRVEYNKREHKSASNSVNISRTLFCGSTDAMFDPDAPLGEIEESPEVVEKPESPFPNQSSVEEPKNSNSHPQPSYSLNPSLELDNNGAEIELKSAAIEAPAESKGKIVKKTKRKTREKNRAVQKKSLNSAAPLLCVGTQADLTKQITYTPQTVPVCTMPQTMVVPVPVGMPTCGFIPFYEHQQNQSWNSMERKSSQIRCVSISETSSSSDSVTRSCEPRQKKMIRQEKRFRKKSSSFSSFSSLSDTTSFNSGSTFSPSLGSSSRTISSSSIPSYPEEERTSDAMTTSVMSETPSECSDSSYPSVSITESSSCED